MSFLYMNAFDALGGIGQTLRKIDRYGLSVELALGAGHGCSSEVRLVLSGQRAALTGVKVNFTLANVTADDTRFPGPVETDCALVSLGTYTLARCDFGYKHVNSAGDAFTIFWDNNGLFSFNGAFDLTAAPLPPPVTPEEIRAARLEMDADLKLYDSLRDV